MSKIPDDLKYSKEHEWVRIAGAQVTIGITDYAQQQLGDIVFVELPKVGAQFNQGAVMGMIESVKAAAELCAPIGGKITAINEAVHDEPELVNEDPYSDGWLVQLQVTNTPNSRTF